MKGRLIYGVLGQNHQANQGMFLLRLVGFLQVSTSTKPAKPREMINVAFQGMVLASFSACRRPLPVSFSRTSKRRYRGPINRSSRPGPCMIHKPRNFGLVILSRWLKFSRYNTVAIHSKPVLINYHTRWRVDLGAYQHRFPPFYETGSVFK